MRRSLYRELRLRWAWHQYSAGIRRRRRRELRAVKGNR